MNILRLAFIFITYLSVMSPAIAAKPVLTIYTYDSFTSDWGPGPAVETEFEKICECDLQFVGLDSSIGILGRIQLEGKNTKADIALGLDTNLVHIAKETGYFAELPSTIKDIHVKNSSLPIEYDDKIFMPFDWGWFGFVFNKNILKNPPKSFQELSNMPDDIKVVIQDPRTSTPGLGLLLWIKSVYGDKSTDYWRELQPKILTVTKGWSEAYALFLDGEADMVLSYTTSPAYHLIAEENDHYDATVFAEGNYLQIEVAGMLKSSSEPELAAQFLEFMASPEFQNIIPTTNWMYPAYNAEIPEGFEALAKPSKTLLFDSKSVATNQKNWIDEWLTASTK